MNSVINAFDKAYTQAINNCNGLWLSSAYTLLQTAFVHLESTNPHVAQHTHKIHNIFSNLVDFGWVCWGAYAVGVELDRKYNITTFSPAQGSLVAGMAALSFLTAFIAASQLNKYFQPSYGDPNDLLVVEDQQGADISQQVRQDQNISITFKHPLNQLTAQRLFIARIILNVALAAVSKNPTLPICNLLGQAYSLVKLSQLKWLNFSRVFNYNNSAERIADVKVSYRALLTPFSNPTAEDTCAICLEDDPLDENPTSYFCSLHPFHNACLISNIYTKSNCFDKISRFTLIETTSNSGISYSYNVEIAQENLPECPLRCNDQYPSHAYFDIVVNDKYKGKFHANVVLTDQKFEPQPALPLFFEGLNLVYNLFHTSLTFIHQKHPELTSRILKTQRVLLAADALALVRDYMQLHRHIKAYVKRKKNEQQLRPRISMIIAAVASSALAAAGVYWMSRNLKPSVDLSEALKTAAALTTAGFENVNVYWSTPRLHKLSQFLSLNRIAINVLSAFLTSGRQRFFHGATVALQTFSLYKTSQLPWIKFEKTFNNPNGSIWSSPGSQHAINSLKLESHFLIQKSTDKDTLPSTLKSIYDYCTNFFDHCSSWSKYWRITRTNGVETIRKLMYDVAVRPSPLQGEPTTYIDRMTAWAVDRYHGSTQVNLL